MITFVLSTEDFELVAKRLRFEDFERVTSRDRSVLCSLTDAQASGLIDRLGDQLAKKGFQDDWEPNEYGHRIEALIDTVGRDLWKK